MLSEFDYDYLCSQVKFVILIDVYFRRLKINHDSYEFILEFSTVANNSLVSQKDKNEFCFHS
jgi:hypothetical protein